MNEVEIKKNQVNLILKCMQSVTTIRPYLLVKVLDPPRNHPILTIEATQGRP